MHSPLDEVVAPPRPRLVPHPGPAHSPTSQTGVGLVSPEPLLLSTPPRTGLADGAERAEPIDLPVPDAGPALGSGLCGHLVETTDELSFAVLPEALTVGAEEDPEQRWAATAVTLDLVFDDGTRLSGLGVTDQYGAGLTPSAQAEARRSWPDQWNLRTVSLRRAAGRRIAEVRVQALPHPERSLRCWLDQITVSAAPDSPASLLEAVDTRRGTHSGGDFSRGNNAPLVCVPHGGLFGLPMTDASAGGWPYSYHAHSGVDTVTGRVRPSLQGFATSHLPSPWMGDRGVFILAPSARTAPPTAKTPEARAERALWFDHAEETAGPHLYAVQLSGTDDQGSRTGIGASLTASHHAIGLSFDFASPGSVILDHRGWVRDASWHVQDGTLTLQGVLADRDDAPAQHLALRITGVSEAHLAADDAAQGLGGHVTVGAGRVEAVVALSEVSVECARKHLREAGSPARTQQAEDAAQAAGTVPAMVKSAERLWREIFDRVRLGEPDLPDDPPARRDRLTVLASCLYRVYAYPNRAGESTAEERLVHRNPAGDVLDRRIAPEAAPELAEGELTVTNGFWDTYRTEWPLLGLLDPVRAAELADGLLAHARGSTWMPRWSAPGPRDIMTGTSSDIVLADLMVREVPGVDWTQAYRTAVRHACTAPSDPRIGRKGLRPGLFRGYINTDTAEGLSWTLDNAINDAGAALMARTLLRSGITLPDHDLAAEAEYFARRALSYQHVFHRGRGFFIGRTPEGRWRSEESFDPDVWGHDYTETNAWGTRVTAPHDPTGLCELYGSEETLAAALDDLMSRPERASEETSGSYGFVIHEQREARDCRQAMLALSNQPAHHIPFMYMAAGRHDQAHRIVRDAQSRLFVGSDLGQGYPGDEDNGEMSAWWLFTSLGLYPLVPASGEYVLCPPLWRDISIDLPGAAGPGGIAEETPARLRVTTDGPLPLEGGSFIRSVRIDGEPWDAVAVPHSRIRHGAHLHVELAEVPCAWAADSRPAGLTERLREADLPNEPLDDAVLGTADPAHAPLTDDAGETALSLRAGETVELLLRDGVLRDASAGEAAAGSAPVEEAGLLYTVTSSEACQGAAWQLTGVDAEGTERVLDQRRSEAFSWDRQTRPFRPAERGGAATGGQRDSARRSSSWRRLRFTALSDLTLEQLEAFLS